MGSAATSAAPLTAGVAWSPSVAASTEHGSPAFYEFMEAIAGPRVKLQGFQHFRGGLDVTSAPALTDAAIASLNAAAHEPCENRAPHEFASVDQIT